ncbi:hypothetical protein [Winogradskyella psychrotolerans]|uniref:hypothetical protein n=1 Tax=Winogradskyella psychrotolerans TaxID=1344585 RepID=UPI001C077B88|nr:hypothetical protein [Winogradskyella psychrotolerans]MBU2929678.1 hypothetical protein [Winogradskyella psychrotolerans]
MKNNTILYVLLIFLIVVNGFFLYNYIGSVNDTRPNEPQRNNEIIVKELDFNAEQLKEFKERSKGHHKTIMRLSDDVRALKDQLFGTLSNDSISEKTIDSITALICVKETEKEKEIFYHFRMIQDISNEKQKEKFQRILMDALRQGESANRPPPPNGEEGHRPPPR